jgi:hypothetical protein
MPLIRQLGGGAEVPPFRLDHNYKHDGGDSWAYGVDAPPFRLGHDCRDDSGGSQVCAVDGLRWN